MSNKRGNGNRRLMRLVKILEAVPDEATNQQGGPAYNQCKFIHPCGSPACALGYYAANTPRRFKFFGNTVILANTDTAGFFRHGEYVVTEEFDITEREAFDLFGYHGCGNAETARQAAAFIRKFVEARKAHPHRARE